MPSAEENLLAGIISSRTNERKEAETIQQNISNLIGAGGAVRFKDKSCAKLAEIVCKYNQQTGAFLDQDTLSAILANRSISPEELSTIQFLFSSALAHDIPPAKFRWWLAQTQETDNAISLTDCLAKALTIVEGRVEDRDGVVFSGFKDATTFLQAELGRLVSTSNISVQPSGNTRAEMSQMLDEVDKAERGETHTGRIMTGFDFIDKASGGHDKGDFMMIGAYTGEGKSQMCANIGWHASTVQSKNVLIITAETAREKYRRRLVARHTHVKGVGVIGGIPYEAIKTGQWESEAQREMYLRVLDDYCNNKSYGILDVTQIPAGGTIIDVVTQANNFQQKYGVELDVCEVDYLALLAATIRRGSRREELNEILQKFKEFCLTFNNGKGVFGIAAHQMKQDRREEVKAEVGKFYSVSDYADTSEAGKSIDTGVVLFRDEDLKKVKELAAALVKLRDGDCPSEIFRLYEDYATSYIGNLAKAA